MAFLVVEQRSMNVMNIVNVQKHRFADIEAQDVDEVEESEGSPQTSVQRRILEAIEIKLLIDPFKYGKKLVGKKGPGRWRFRVGDYRVRFDIEGSALLFYRVRHRREIYD